MPLRIRPNNRRADGTVKRSDFGTTRAQKKGNNINSARVTNWKRSTVYAVALEALIVATVVGIGLLSTNKGLVIGVAVLLHLPASIVTAPVAFRYGFDNSFVFPGLIFCLTPLMQIVVYTCLVGRWLNRK